MQLWPSSDTEGGCCSVSAVRDARRVCDLLGIAHYQLNYRDIFERDVVTPFAQQYAAGQTPNPCIACNDRVKFADLLAKVAAQGAEFLATGHYARIERDESGVPWLARGVDPGKDQSYFLYRLTREQMGHVLFPVGELHKVDVRGMAERFGLPTAHKAESQETCFATDGDYAAVVGERVPAAVVPGDIVGPDGTVLGRHEGIAHFTVGQRKGIGIGGTGEPLFVLRVEPEANRVVVGSREDLSVTRVEARDVVWQGPPSARVGAVVRYRMAAHDAIAQVDRDALVVRFDEPLYGVAPGQSVVCYEGDRVVGGGVISCAS